MFVYEIINTHTFIEIILLIRLIFILSQYLYYKIFKGFVMKTIIIVIS